MPDALTRIIETLTTLRTEVAWPAPVLEQFDEILAALRSADEVCVLLARAHQELALLRAKVLSLGAKVGTRGPYFCLWCDAPYGPGAEDAVHGPQCVYDRLLRGENVEGSHA